MILVVAAVLVDDLTAPTRILAARRRTPPALAGYWEFPGGKVEPGEDPLGALHRELAEELGVTVVLGAEIIAPGARTWPISRDLEMRLWFAAIDSGQPISSGSHDELAWLTAEQLFDVEWLPADTAIVTRLRDQLRA